MKPTRKLAKDSFSKLALFSGDDVKSLLHVFCRNVIGHAAGMYLFREYLRGTSGARVVSCWMHVQAFRKAQDPERRLELFSAIRHHYLQSVITLPGPGSLLDIVASGMNEAAVAKAVSLFGCSQARVTLPRCGGWTHVMNVS